MVEVFHAIRYKLIDFQPQMFSSSVYYLFTEHLNVLDIIQNIWKKRKNWSAINFFSKCLTVLSLFLEQYVNKLIYDCSLMKILISMSHFKSPCKSQEAQDINHYDFINH